MGGHGRFLQQLWQRRAQGKAPFSWLAFALLLAGASGCASSAGNFSRIVNEPAPLPADLRASFGRMGVLPDDVPPELVIEYPSTRSEVMMSRMGQTFNALEKSRWESTSQRQPSGPPPKPAKPAQPGIQSQPKSSAASGSKSAGDTLGNEFDDLAGGLLFDMLAAGMTGVVDAMIEGVSEKELEHGETTLRRALLDDPLQPGIQRCLFQDAAGLRLDNLVPLPDSELTGLGHDAGTNGLQVLAGRGIDSVLLVRIINQQFSLHGHFDPPMFFTAEADVRVVRVSDGAVLHFGTLIYRSDERQFGEWGAHNARSFRAEMKTAQKMFAEALLEQLCGVDVAR
jgi:hypothetical protein